MQSNEEAAARQAASQLRRETLIAMLERIGIAFVAGTTVSSSVSFKRRAFDDDGVEMDL